MEMTPSDLKEYEALQDGASRARWLLAKGVIARLTIDPLTLAPAYQAYAAGCLLPNYYPDAEAAVAISTAWLAEIAGVECGIGRRSRELAAPAGSAEPVTAERLGAVLAQEIFKIGNDPRGKCTRIQFMLGTWPDNEMAGGGLCQASLEDVLVKRLKEWGCPSNTKRSDPDQ